MDQTNFEGYRESSRSRCLKTPPPPRYRGIITHLFEMNWSHDKAYDQSYDLRPEI